MEKTLLKQQPLTTGLQYEKSLTPSSGQTLLAKVWEPATNMLGM